MNTVVAVIPYLNILTNDCFYYNCYSMDLENTNNKITVGKLNMSLKIRTGHFVTFCNAKSSFCVGL